MSSKPSQLPPLAPTGAPQPGRRTEAPITVEELRQLRAALDHRGIAVVRVQHWTARKWGIDRLAEIRPAQLAEILARLDRWAVQIAKETEAQREAHNERAAIQLEDARNDHANWLGGYDTAEQRQRLARA